MEVENDYPKFFIISETKINFQSLDNCFHEIFENEKLSWNDKWKRRNNNLTISDMEKLTEVFFEFTNNEAINKMTTEEFNKLYVCKNKKMQLVLDHLYVTVVFTKCSKNFSFLFQTFEGKVIFSKYLNKKLNFWLPSVLEKEKEIAFEVGSQIVNYVEVIEKIFEKLKNKNYANEKIQECIEYAIPQCATLNVIASGSLNNWKKFIIENTSFSSLDESRYVFMNLLRLFKMKWSSLLLDVVLLDEKNEVFNIDSIITSSDSYKKFRTASIQL
ncbi:MAG: hypothetical protein NZZ41_03915 [Candidatus Dojkabacteria bacterium]|nr:hypothetical protein [Candidatus Dojkabacteria bacterium]